MAQELTLWLPAALTFAAALVLAITLMSDAQRPNSSQLMLPVAASAVVAG